VFPVALVPHRNDQSALGIKALEGAKLRYGLMGETISDADGQWVEGTSG
jgi:hypothetical protein